VKEKGVRDMRGLKRGARIHGVGFKSIEGLKIKFHNRYFLDFLGEKIK
jgi:hypothetical protein